jgi:hypothetical protein
MSKVAQPIEGLVRSDWKVLAKVVNAFNKFASKVGWVILKIAQSEYTKEFVRFLIDNAGLIIKAVLTAAKAGGTNQEKHDIAFNTISEAVPNLQSHESWINAGIQLAIVIIKAIAASK